MKTSHLFLYACAAFSVFSFQVLAWWIIYGSPVLVPQGQGFVRLLHPRFLAVFFARANGLITWTPIVLPAILGLLGWLRGPKRRSLGIAVCICLAAQVYLNASVRDWHAGMGFGARRFVGSIPLLLLGLGNSIEWARRRIPTWQVASLVFLLVLWNALFLVQYYIPLAPRSRPWTWEEIFHDKIRLARAMNSLAYRQAAWAALRRGDLHEAQATIEIALEEVPHCPENHIRAAVVCSLIPSALPEAAVHHLLTAIRLTGEEEYVRSTFIGETKKLGCNPQEIIRSLGRVGNPSPGPPGPSRSVPGDHRASE